MKNAKKTYLRKCNNRIETQQKIIFHISGSCPDLSSVLRHLFISISVCGGRGSSSDVGKDTNALDTYDLDIGSEVNVSTDDISDELNDSEPGMVITEQEGNLASESLLKEFPE